MLRPKTLAEENEQLRAELAHWRGVAEENEQLRAELAHWRGVAEAMIGAPLVPDEISRASPQAQRLFRILHAGLGRVITKNAIFDALYGSRPDCDVPSAKVLDVYVSKLRARLKTFVIKTHWGQGFSMHKAGEGDAG